jgi:uncharacterized repeat protein (TIGR01451 family)
MRKLLAASALALLAGWAPAAPASADVIYSGFDDDLLAYWPFDEGSGPALDQAPSDATADNGTLTNGATRDCANPAPVPGSICALSLDGIDDYVAVGHSAELDFTAAYTVSAWVNSDDVALATYRPILVRGANDGVTDANDLEIYIQAVSKDLIVAVNRGNACAFDYVGFVDPPLGSYFHLAVVFDGGQVKAYYNGAAAAVAQQNINVLAPCDTDKGWMIGKVNHVAFAGAFPAPNRERHFDGLLDEVRIYDRALSEDEIDVLASSFTIRKTLTSASGTGSEIDTGEQWTFNMQVEVENNGPLALSNLMVKDPLPGDLQLDSSPYCASGLTPSGITTATAEAFGATNKCTITWEIGDLGGSESAQLGIAASTDLNPKGKQEYTTARAAYCIDKEAVLTGTIGPNDEPFIARSNGIEVPAAPTAVNPGPVYDTICDGAVTAD